VQRPDDGSTWQSWFDGQLPSQVGALEPLQSTGPETQTQTPLASVAHSWPVGHEPLHAGPLAEQGAG
jgi:predicted component of type VI protein secretion system